MKTLMLIITFLFTCFSAYCSDTIHKSYSITMNNHIYKCEYTEESDSCFKLEFTDENDDLVLNVILEKNTRRNRYACPTFYTKGNRFIPLYMKSSEDRATLITMMKECREFLKEKNYELDDEDKDKLFDIETFIILNHTLTF